MGKAWILGVTSALALSGCSDSLTNKATPERLQSLRTAGIDAEERAKIEQRALAALEDNPTAAALARQYDGVAAPRSLGLTEALTTALERNPDIGRAAQRINRRDAERLSAIYGYLPQVTLSATFAENRQEVIQSDNAVFQLGEATFPSTEADLELRQPLLDIAQIYEIRLAGTIRRTAEVEYIAAVQSVVFDTFDAYLSAAQSRNRVNSLGRRADLLGQQRRAEASRETAGLSDTSIVDALEIETAAIEVEQAQEQVRYDRARAELTRLTGTPVTDVAIPSIPAGVSGTERRISPAQAIETALQTNPEILASFVAIAERDLAKRQAIAADFAPVLEAFARLEYEQRDASRFGGGSEVQDSILGVRLTVPLFNARGEGYSNLLARIDFSDAVVQYFAKKAEITTDITATHARMASLSRSISQSQQGLSSARSLVTAEQSLVDAGRSQQFVVATRQDRVTQSEERLRFYQLEYLRAWGRMQYLSGMNLADRL